VLLGNLGNILYTVVEGRFSGRCSETLNFPKSG
jgi:hypothetical protein